MRFKTHLTQRQMIGLFPGRFSVPTIAHQAIIDQMVKLHDINYVILIEGSQSSKNKVKNPFNLELQKEMLTEIIPSGVGLIVAKNGFLPDIIKKQLIPNLSSPDVVTNGFMVYAGSDRIAGYREQQRYIEDYKLNFTEKKRNDPTVSATRVREALLDGDQSLFNKLTPKKIHSYYKKLHREIIKVS